MIENLINPADSPARQTEKLLTIAQVLMRRVEQITDDSGAAYAQFQRAATLEDLVRDRTRDLERALDLLNASNGALALANRETESARRNLADAIETIQEGFALFDPGDVLVMCNSRFGIHLDDLRPYLKPGLTFDDYVERVSRSQFFTLPAGSSAQDWAVQRRRRHLDAHVNFNVAMIWDRWVQVSEHRTGDGGTVILQTDITDIIRLERQERGKLLDDQARMIRATLDHINQGVAIFDADACLVGWNQRLGALLAIPVAKMRLGTGFAQIAQSLDAEFDFLSGMTARGMADWVDGRHGRPAVSFEMRRGQGVILAVFAQEMPESGFVISFSDVTAERSAIDALSRANETLEARVFARTLELQDALATAERANASRSRFVAAASHDLLQPLSAAKLFIAAIDDPAMPAPARGALDKAQAALMSVEGILDALLNISKLESGKAAVALGPVRMDLLLGQLRDEFSAIAAAKGLGLTIRICDSAVISDAAYLRRILQNLIGNAIRYTISGRVLVGTRRRGDLLRVEVWDTGPGIPEAEQENIFKEFHRLNAPASASEGMGLGLAIVERACALLGHPLGLSSQIGRGTCFALHVPIAPRTMALTADLAPMSPDMPAQNCIAFLVENDEALRRAMGLLLEKWGVSVLESATGEEALALIDELGILPDFFLVDHHLGDGMDGLAFVDAIHQRHGPVPIRLITANRTDSLRNAAQARGTKVLVKPIDARALLAVVAELGQTAALTTKEA